MANAMETTRRRAGVMVAAVFFWAAGCGAETGPGGMEPRAAGGEAGAAALTAPASGHERAVHVQLTLEIGGDVVAALAELREMLETLARRVFRVARQLA